MLKFSAAALALALCVATTALGAVDTRDRLGHFERIVSCAPFGVYVAPGTGTTYNVQIDAEDAVTKKISTTVTGGTLNLGVSGDFTTNKAIKVVVNMPATALKGVTSGASSSVEVAAGLNVSALAVTLTGTGEVSVESATIGVLVVSASGTGTVVVGGDIGATSVQHSGTGAVGLSGTKSTVQYTGSGTGQLYVKGTSSTVISGSTTGLSSITYDKGACNLPANFPFASPCKQTDSVTLPSVNTKWTCGLTVTGTFGVTNGQCDSSSYVNGITTTSGGSASPGTCSQPSS